MQASVATQVKVVESLSKILKKAYIQYNNETLETDYSKITSLLDNLISHNKLIRKLSSAIIAIYLKYSEEVALEVVSKNKRMCVGNFIVLMLVGKLNVSKYRYQIESIEECEPLFKSNATQGTLFFYSNARHKSLGLSPSSFEEFDLGKIITCKDYESIPDPKTTLIIIPAKCLEKLKSKEVVVHRSNFFITKKRVSRVQSPHKPVLQTTSKITAKRRSKTNLPNERVKSDSPSHPAGLHLLLKRGQEVARPDITGCSIRSTSKGRLTSTLLQIEAKTANNKSGFRILKSRSNPKRFSIHTSLISPGKGELCWARSQFSRIPDQRIETL